MRQEYVLIVRWALTVGAVLTLWNTALNGTFAARHNKPLLSTGGWQTVAPSGAGFSVLMPKPVQSAVQPMTTPGMTIHEFTARMDSMECDADFYDLSDLSPNLRALLSPDKLIDDLASQKGATLISKRVIALAGNPGREYAYTTDGGQRMVTRFFVIGSRVLGLSVILHTSSAATRDAADHFLDSLKISH